MADRLEALLDHFSVRARVFNAGALCGINSLEAGSHGHLHLVREGSVEVRHGRAPDLRIERPSLLLYPRPMAHRFVTDPVRGADLVCAELDFDGDAGNPIAATLPAIVCLPLDQLAGGDRVLTLLFDEAFGSYCGRRAMVDRLFEVLLIQLLRHLMETGQVESGMLAGLSHPRLRHALIAMHEAPATDWSLDTLAARAGMSRSHFAESFRDTVGSTPGHYLQHWRIGLAQKWLRNGRPLKLIADEIGYGSEAALSRAFKAVTGRPPGQWRSAQAH